MSTEADFDIHGWRDCSSPNSPLPHDIEEILALQQARMEKLLEQATTRNRRELARALKAASKAQESRIYKDMRKKVIDEELPRIRFYLKKELAPSIMEELTAESARASSSEDGQDRGPTTSHHLDSRDGRSRSPERVEQHHRHRSPSRGQKGLEKQGFKESASIWNHERRCSVDNKGSETKQAIPLPSEKQDRRRGLRRSSSEAHLDDKEECQLVGPQDLKRARTGPEPISMCRSPNISFQSSPQYYFPSRSQRRHLIRSHSKRQLLPLSRAMQVYLRAERLIPSIEDDGPPLTEEQLKDAGRCLSYYTRPPDEGEGEGDGFMPPNSEKLPSEIPSVDKPLTPFGRQNGVGSEEDLLPDNSTPQISNSPAGFIEQGRTPHGTPPLRQPQQAENGIALLGRLPHGWYASQNDLQKTLEIFPFTSEFMPLLIFYDQRHILIEREGLYFFWDASTNSLEIIDKPKELQELLKEMDNGRILPIDTSLPTHLASLAHIELVKAEDLRHWSSSVVIHHSRSSIDHALRQGLIRLGSGSLIHESDAVNLNVRDGEKGAGPFTMLSRHLDNTQGALYSRDGREPGHNGSDEDDDGQGAFLDDSSVIFPPRSLPPSASFEEGTTLKNPADLTSSPLTLQRSPTYGSFTRSNSNSDYFAPDDEERRWDYAQGALRHSDSKELSDEGFGEQVMLDRYQGWEMNRKGIANWEYLKGQLRRDEEQYP